MHLVRYSLHFPFSSVFKLLFPREKREQNAEYRLLRLDLSMFFLWASFFLLRKLKRSFLPRKTSLILQIKILRSAFLRKVVVRLIIILPPPLLLLKMIKKIILPPLPPLSLPMPFRNYFLLKRIIFVIYIPSFRLDFPSFIPFLLLSFSSSFSFFSPFFFYLLPSSLP